MILLLVISVRMVAPDVLWLSFIIVRAQAHGSVDAANAKTLSNWQSIETLAPAVKLSDNLNANAS